MFKSFAAASLAALANADALVGTNIGGWMVLEPWITPSLFYRFLGNTHSEGVGMDSYTFCEALGPVEGNAVMRAHWDSWVTEDLIKDLADREVEVVRVPIGDWTTTPYGPYVGCMDGAAEKIEWLLDTCAEYGIKVLLDVHAIKGSQNGFDNSGQAANVEWTDENNFKHWSISAANWMGPWNGWGYDYIDSDNIQWAVDNVTALMAKWGNHPAFYALEPVNEPWWSSDIPTLKQFYRDTREEVRKVNPNALFVFHDSFITDAGTWNDLFADDDMENVVMDTHQYMAWWERKEVISRYCEDYTSVFNNFRDIKYPMWVGEWALATDVCAFWLGGFNDSNTEY
jgi:glucan 1,3-beta-glucosidase